MSRPCKPAAAVRRAMMGTAARVTKNASADMAALAATAARTAGSVTVRAGHSAVTAPTRAMVETWACLDSRRGGNVLAAARLRGGAVRVRAEPAPLVRPVAARRVAMLVVLRGACALARGADSQAAPAEGARPSAGKEKVRWAVANVFFERRGAARLRCVVASVFFTH
jgi:hypothetical protein